MKNTDDKSLHKNSIEIPAIFKSIDNAYLGIAKWAINSPIFHADSARENLGISKPNQNVSRNDKAVECLISAAEINNKAVSQNISEAFQEATSAMANGPVGVLKTIGKNLRNR